MDTLKILKLGYRRYNHRYSSKIVNITDNGLYYIARMNLDKLYLNYCTRITDVGYEYVSSFDVIVLLETEHDSN